MLKKEYLPYLLYSQAKKWNHWVIAFWCISLNLLNWLISGKFFWTTERNRQEDKKSWEIYQFYWRSCWAKEKDSCKLSKLNNFYFIFSCCCCCFCLWENMFLWWLCFTCFINHKCQFAEIFCLSRLRITQNCQR